MQPLRRELIIGALLLLGLVHLLHWRGGTWRSSQLLWVVTAVTGASVGGTLLSMGW